jgi:hypothetical protein
MEGGVVRMKWRTQDWIWVIILSFFAQGMAYVYKDWLMQIVSFGSTFVSISLAAVAIYISVREATKGDNVKDQINVMLGELREKVSQMDIKLNQFDPTDLKVKKADKIEDFKEEIESKLQEGSHLTKEEVMAIVKEESEKLKNSLTVTSEVDEDTKFNKMYNSITKLVSNYLKVTDKAFSLSDVLNYVERNSVYNRDSNFISMVEHRLNLAYKNDILSWDGVVYVPKRNK